MSTYSTLLKKSLYRFRFLIPFIVIIAIAVCYYYNPKFERPEIIPLISAIIVMGSLVFSLITIEGSERTFTYSICADWYKTELNKYHVSIFYFTKDVEINELMERLIEGKLKDGDEDKFQKMVAILNYFQMVATFYLSEKVDKSIVRDNFQHIIIRYCNKFDRLINHYNNNNKNRPLLELEKLYNEFKQTTR
jgi:hypothetical protein